MSGVLTIVAKPEGRASRVYKVTVQEGRAVWEYAEPFKYAHVTDVRVGGDPARVLHGAFIVFGVERHSVILSGPGGPWTVTTVEECGSLISGLELWRDRHSPRGALRPSPAAERLATLTPTATVDLEPNPLDVYWFRGPGLAWTPCAWHASVVRGNVVVLKRAAAITFTLDPAECAGRLVLLATNGPETGQERLAVDLSSCSPLTLEGLPSGAHRVRFQAQNDADLPWFDLIEVGPGEHIERVVQCRRGRASLSLFVRNTELVALTAGDGLKLDVAHVSWEGGAGTPVEPQSFSIASDHIAAEWSDVPAGLVLLRVATTVHVLDLEAGVHNHRDMRLDDLQVRQFLFLDGDTGAEVTPRSVAWSWSSDDRIPATFLTPICGVDASGSPVLEVLCPPGRVALIVTALGASSVHWVHVGDAAVLHEVHLKSPFVIRMISRRTIPPHCLDLVVFERDGVEIPRGDVQYGHRRHAQDGLWEATATLHGAPPHRAFVPSPTDVLAWNWVVLTDGAREHTIQLE